MFSVTGTASTDSLKAQRYVFVKKSASYASLSQSYLSTTIILPAAPIVVHTPFLHPPPAQRKYRKMTTMKRKTTFAPHSNPNAHHPFLFHLNRPHPSTNTNAYPARQPSINPQRPSPVIQVRSKHPVMYPADSHYSSLLVLITTTTHIEKEKQFTRKENEGKSKELDKDNFSNYTKQEEVHACNMSRPRSHSPSEPKSTIACEPMPCISRKRQPSENKTEAQSRERTRTRDKNKDPQPFQHPLPLYNFLRYAPKAVFARNKNRRRVILSCIETHARIASQIQARFEI